MKKLLSLLGVLLFSILLVACGDKTHKVTFDVNGGNEVISEVKIKNGLLLEIPEQPTKDGKIFDFWLNKDNNTKWNFGKDKVTKDITLVAQWKDPLPVTYLVKFYTIGGEPLDDQIVEEGSKVEDPGVPIREGYNFLGWFLPDSSEPYDFNSVVTEDLIISARWEKIEYVTVTFDVNLGLPLIDELILEKGDKLSNLPNVEREGYDFLGWFLGQSLYDFNEEVTKDITLVAKWQKQTLYYSVLFLLDENDENPSEVLVPEGEVLEKPEDIELAGYVFNGWLLDGEEFVFGEVITSNLILIASFTKEHEVNFYLDEELDDLYLTDIVLDNKLLTKPIDPEKIGYKFSGWYLDNLEYNFADEVLSDLDLVAKWSEEFVVRFYLDEEKEELYYSVIVNENELLTEPDEPSIDFMIFKGWYKDNLEYEFLSSVNSSFDLIAKFEEEDYIVRAYIGSSEYRSIGLALEEAIVGDTILIAGGIHDMPFHVSVNDLTFKPVDNEAVVVINAPITLAENLNGVRFENLEFTGAATIHDPGKIDNFVFTGNNVYDLDLNASPFQPANRVDVNAFIRFYTMAGGDIVGNVTITNNTFTNIDSVVISLARTSAGKEIKLENNEFHNIKQAAIRFDGGYNNGTYTITNNLFHNDEGVENLAVILFRAYSATNGNTQIINILENEFINVGSTAHPIAETHPGSGVILFSTYNEFDTVVTISDNIFTNTKNTIHLRDNRGNHTNLKFNLTNNEFNDPEGFIFYESNYRVADEVIVFEDNVYYIDEILTDVEDLSDQIIRAV